jgi:hypothetical protein
VGSRHTALEDMQDLGKIGLAEYIPAPPIQTKDQPARLRLRPLLDWCPGATPQENACSEKEGCEVHAPSNLVQTDCKYIEYKDKENEGVE